MGYHRRSYTLMGMSICQQFTDAGLSRLIGIHSLLMTLCGLTGLAHPTIPERQPLAGHERVCLLATDAALAQLRGIHTLTARSCPLLTAEGLEVLRKAGTDIDGDV